MKLRNIISAILDQGPFSRFLRNLRAGHLSGLWHINSHISQGSGKPKVKYNSKATAIKSAESMGKKTGSYFSNYKCMFCDGYHIGKNRDI